MLPGALFRSVLACGFVLVHVGASAEGGEFVGRRLQRVFGSREFVPALFQDLHQLTNKQPLRLGVMQYVK